MKEYDKIIIGAGLYGLYAALYCCKKGQNVIILECEDAPFKRATYINQARVHQGYHYPRSISTAIKSAMYFDRFNKDYSFCINRDFDQIYATSAKYSWADSKQFKEFCKAAGIPCEELDADRYFKSGVCDGVFRTREYTYDAMLLRDFLLKELEKYRNSVSIKYGVNIINIERSVDSYLITDNNGNEYRTSFVLNATYSGTNQILHMTDFKKLRIKYELCEIILCEPNSMLKEIGITVMDGPFFSIMPFGKTGFHSLTSVTFTPHMSSHNDLPSFSCQKHVDDHCTISRLGNCNECMAKPKTAFPYMSALAHKYMLDDYAFTYNRSLFSVKPILESSEIDDSRPTVINCYSKKPTFITVLSGKINTVYDLDEVLNYD